MLNPQSLTEEGLLNIDRTPYVDVDISAMDLQHETRDYSFNYDPLNRLSHAQGPYGEHVYNYDGVGNRNSLEINGLIEQYHYAQDSQQLESRTSEGGGTQYSYNLNGNVVTVGDLGISDD